MLNGAHGKVRLFQNARKQRDYRAVKQHLI